MADQSTKSVTEGAVSKALSRLTGDRWLECSLHAMETHLNRVHWKQGADASHPTTTSCSGS